MYNYLQPEKIRQIEKSLRLLKISQIEKSLRLLKIRRIEKSLRLLKIRRIEKFLCLLKIRWTIESLRALNSCAWWKTQVCRKAGETKQACLLFRRSGISNCWLLPGLADGHVKILVDVMNLACSLQVRGRLRLPSPVLYRPAMPRNDSNPHGNQKSGFRLEFCWFLSNHKIPNSACVSVLSLSRKKDMITVAVQYQLSYSRPPN